MRLARRTDPPLDPAQRPGHQHPRPGEPARAVAMVLGLTAGLSLILALFVSIAVNSGPNGVRLAVAGPAPAVQQITAAVTRAGGPDAFEVTVVGDEAAARAALEERTADGAIVVGPNGPTVFTASAGSPAIAQALNAAAGELAGAQTAGPAVVDVVPVPEGDAHGSGSGRRFPPDDHRRTCPRRRRCALPAWPVDRAAHRARRRGGDRAQFRRSAGLAGSLGRQLPGGGVCYHPRGGNVGTGGGRTRPADGCRGRGSRCPAAGDRREPAVRYRHLAAAAAGAVGRGRPVAAHRCGRDPGPDRRVLPGGIGGLPGVG